MITFPIDTRMAAANPFEAVQRKLQSEVDVMRADESAYSKAWTYILFFVCFNIDQDYPQYIYRPPAHRVHRLT